MERKSLNIVKQKEHLTFNHALKRGQILPKSLRFNPPVKCKEGFRITKKAGWSLLKLRIQSSHQRIKQLDEQCSDLVRKLSSIISQEHFDALSKVISHNASKLKEKVKNRHSQKLTDMGAFVTEDPYVDKNRWVINLSNRQLSEHETSALQNGLNFATIPKTVPTSHIVANIESGIYNLSGSAKATIRASVVNILRNSKPETTQNITRQQLAAVRTLQRDPTVTVVPADKGKAVVVMDTVEYREKVRTLLSDKDAYTRITDKRRNPTSRVEKDLNNLLSEIKSCSSTHDQDVKQMDPKTYHRLHITDASPASFYGLPKIHKPGVPLRPITSCINAPTYNVSRHLVSILSPLLEEKYSVTNSVVFAQHVRDQPITEDEIMVSFDVVALFTSIPVDLALQIVRDKLQQDVTLTERTDISVTNIMRLLEFVLKNSFFTYEQEHYQQTFGCAMGSPVSATVANLVMEHIEERAISTAAHPPRWWYRYVDDSHACLKKDYVQEFHDHLNSVNPNIQFTKEVEQDNRLSFLDTTTTRVRGRIQVSVYRKPTHTDKYLDYNSHHPSQHKRSVVNTLLHRTQEIPSTNAERSRERKHVIKVLRDNNYPLSFIRSCKSYHNSSHRDSSTNGSSSASAPSASPFVVLPYARGVSEKISRVLRNNGVKVGYKPLNVLRTCFPRPKDKTPALQCRGVVYRVACADCNFVYYGQTDRALETRLKEHKRAVRVGDNNSKVAQHANQFVHSIDFDHATIVDRARNFHERLFLEAWYSQRDSNAGNEHIDIPDVYKSLA